MKLLLRFLHGILNFITDVTVGMSFELYRELRRLDKMHSAVRRGEITDPEELKALHERTLAWFHSAAEYFNCVT